MVGPAQYKSECAQPEKRRFTQENHECAEDQASCAKQQSDGPSLLSGKNIVNQYPLAANAPPIAMDAVNVSIVGSRRVIVAIVVRADGNGEQLTVGSALSSGDDGEATVKAVLGALNRRIERIKV